MTAQAPAPKLRSALVELVPTSDLHAALRFAWRSMKASAHLCPQLPGVHVFAIVDHELVMRFLPAQAEAHVLIGSDPRCDLRLPGLAPRQLLLRTHRLPDGVMSVRLLDVGRGRGVRTADGHSTRSLVASGPFAVSARPYVIGALPHDASLYARDADLVAPLIERARRLPSYAIPGIGGRRPRITCLPGARGLPDLAPARYTHVAKVRVRRGRHEASIALDRETLARGVLLGRARRSAPTEWRRVLGSNVSPEHMVLFREGDRTVAFDLRGDRGTFAAGVPIRGARLPKECSTLTLGRVDPAEICVEPS